VGVLEEDRVEVIRVADGKVVGGFSSGELWHYRSRRGTDEEPLFVPDRGRAVFSADGKRVLLTKGGVTSGIELGLWDIATGKRLNTFHVTPSTM
jgi:hypothetical protein